MTHNLLSRSIATVRAGRSFVFAPFNLDENGFHDRAVVAAAALAENRIGLPYDTFCGMAALLTGGQPPSMAMAMAEAIEEHH